MELAATSQRPGCSFYYKQYIRIYIYIYQNINHVLTEYLYIISVHTLLLEYTFIIFILLYCCYIVNYEFMRMEDKCVISYIHVCSLFLLRKLC